MDVERLPIVREVDGHAAGRDVDQQVDSNKISPSVVTSSGMATTAGRIAVRGLEHVGSDPDVGQDQLPDEERRQADGARYVRVTNAGGITPPLASNAKMP